jgi:1-acyl-sn-glycerol-3-phosphate acyltransferase
VSTRPAWAIFDLFLRPWMSAHLRVHVAGAREALAGATPWTLVCANHESFWDGFVLRALQRRILPGVPFHAVMLRRELDRRRWLALLGALPLDPGSTAGVRATLRALRALRGREPEGVLAWFPQGRIRPGDPRPLGFRAGVAAAAEALAPVRVLPVGIRLLPGRTRRTEAYVSVGAGLEVGVGGRPSAARLEEAVAGELDAIRAHLAAHGEEAPERWPRGGASLARPSEPSWISHGVERWISRN